MTHSKFSTTILRDSLASKIESNKYNIYSKIDGHIFHNVLQLKFVDINDGIIDIDISVVDSKLMKNADAYLGHLFLIDSPFYIQVGDNTKKILEINLRNIIDSLDEIGLLLESNTQYKLDTNELNNMVAELAEMMYDGFHNYKKKNIKEQIINNIKVHIENSEINKQKSEDNEIFSEMLNKLNETASRQMINLYVSKIKEILDKYNDDYYINLLKITVNDDKMEYFKDYL